MPYRNWVLTKHELVTVLRELEDHEFLVLGERPCWGTPEAPFSENGPHSAPTRYVQVLRVEDFFSAECVGPRSDGGAWEMNDDTVEVLRSLAWRTPSESRAASGAPTPNFCLYAELDRAEELADLLITSLQVLDAAPQLLELRSTAIGA